MTPQPPSACFDDERLLRAVEECWGGLCPGDLCLSRDAARTFLATAAALPGAELEVVWHWTRRSALPAIQREGLRVADGAGLSVENGRRYGAGVYASSSYWSHRGRYGDAALLCVSLSGQSAAAERYSTARRRDETLVFRSAAQLLACASVREEAVLAALTAARDFVDCLRAHLDVRVAPWLAGAEEHLQRGWKRGRGGDGYGCRRPASESEEDSAAVAAPPAHACGAARVDREFQAMLALGVDPERLQVGPASPWPQAREVWRLRLSVGAATVAVQLVFPPAYPFSAPLVVVRGVVAAKQPQLVSPRGAIDVPLLLDVDAWNPAVRAAWLIRALRLALEDGRLQVTAAPDEAEEKRRRRTAASGGSASYNERDSSSAAQLLPQGQRRKKRRYSTTESGAQQTQDLTRTATAAPDVCLRHGP